jgi:hypothetical protein
MFWQMRKLNIKSESVFSNVLFSNLYRFLNWFNNVRNLTQTGRIQIFEKLNFRRNLQIDQGPVS